MRTVIRILILFLMLCCTVPASFTRSSGEFLTEEEITIVQTKQKIEPRVKYYLEIARLRLGSAIARLKGEESVPGDPMEYFTPEDMLNGYYRILDSIMQNLEDAYQRPLPDSGGIKKALKELKKRTEECRRQLDLLKVLAEEHNNGEMLRLIERAVDITAGANEGATLALEDDTQEKE